LLSKNKTKEKRIRGNGRTVGVWLIQFLMIDSSSKGVGMLVGSEPSADEVGQI
jgi:hypothetical protein